MADTEHTESPASRKAAHTPSDTKPHPPAYYLGGPMTLEEAHEEQRYMWEQDVKGAFDTPGPYFIHGCHPDDIRHRSNPGRPLALMPSWVTHEDERAKLCDLLNKGTHFDKMLAALKGLMEKGALGGPDDDVRGRLDAAKAAIAKAEGHDAD